MAMTIDEKRNMLALLRSDAAPTLAKVNTYISKIDSLQKGLTTYKGSHSYETVFADSFLHRYSKNREIIEGKILHFLQAAKDLLEKPSTVVPSDPLTTDEFLETLSNGITKTIRDFPSMIDEYIRAIDKPIMGTLRFKVVRNLGDVVMDEDVQKLNKRKRNRIISDAVLLMAAGLTLYSAIQIMSNSNYNEQSYIYAQPRSDYKTSIAMPGSTPRQETDISFYIPEASQNKQTGDTNQIARTISEALISEDYDILTQLYDEGNLKFGVVRQMVENGVDAGIIHPFVGNGVVNSDVPDDADVSPKELETLFNILQRWLYEGWSNDVGTLLDDIRVHNNLQPRH